MRTALKTLFENNDIKQTLPLIIFHLVIAGIIAANFPFGKYFLGWDSVTPELNFPVNFERSFSGFWQEHYGVGLVGGHGFASLLPHTLVTFLLALVLPMEAVRSTFTFLCLYLGGLGMLLLVRHLLSRAVLKDVKLKVISEYIPFLALVSSLFYVLNLATMQMFAIQLETFIVHFAALPWLFYTLLKLLEHFTVRNILLFAIVSFLAGTQGFIPSLFVAFAVALGILLLAHLIANRFSKAAFIKVAAAGVITGAVNAYWIFPLLYFQLTESSGFLNAYNNLMSTPYFIDITKKYGTLGHVALLRGFMFDSFQLGDYVLSPWITHFSNIIPLSIGYLFFLIITGGVIGTFVFLKDWYLRAFAFIFLFFFINLATNTFPLTYGVHLLQLISPTFEQAFRNAFTKFSIGAAFSYSIFLSIGLLLLLRFWHWARKRAFLTFAALFLLLSIYSIPTFQGDFLYKKLMLNLPPAYKEVMGYFATQPDGRIADFPQECAEGWYSYNWGYFGSGFYWYGVRQPFLARSFDVWSRHNENYYWEITDALKRQNYAAADAVLQKYDVSWVLYDPNAYFCRSNKSVFEQESFLNYLNGSEKYRLVRSYSSPGISPILIYEVVNKPAKAFVSVSSTLPNIGPAYSWTSQDQALFDTNSYLTDPKNAYDLYYPFRSLFTNRLAQEKEFSVHRSDTDITFSTTLPQALAGYTLTIPAYQEVEKMIPISLQLKHVSGRMYSLTAALALPTVSVDNELITKNSPAVTLGTITLASSSGTRILLDGQPVATGSAAGEYRGVYYTTLPGVIDVQSAGTSVRTFTLSQLESFAQALTKPYTVTLPSFTTGRLNVTVPTVKDGQIHGIEQTKRLDGATPVVCKERSKPTVKYEVNIKGEKEFIRLFSTNTTQCVSFHFPHTLTSFGYLLEVDSRTMQGNDPKIIVYNDKRVVYNDVPLRNNWEAFQTFSLILPPTVKDEEGYSVQYQSNSESTNTAIHDLGGMTMWTIPYTYLKTMKLSSDTSATPAASRTSPTDVKHPSSTSYTVTLPSSSEPQTLILSQAFSPGWKAYRMPQGTQSSLDSFLPFLSGAELTDHVRVNNWQNGWTVPQSDTEQTIRIVFLPQYLQYIGFLLLGLPLLLALILTLLSLRRVT